MSMTRLGSTSTGFQEYGAAITQAHTIPSGGVNSILLVGVLTANSVASVTYGGVAMTLAKLNSQDGKTAIYYLVNPTAGTADIVATLGSGTSFGTLIAQAYNGRNLTTPIGATASASAQSTPNSTLAIDASAGLAFSFIGATNSSPNTDPAAVTDWTHGSGQIALANVTDGNEHTAFSSASDKAGATSVNESSTLFRTWSHTAVVILAEPVAAVVPDAPTIGAATVTGATTASINGTAPSNNGGAAIDNYRATLSPSGLTFTSASLPVPCTGLATGTAQTARLEAHNSAGWSSMSAASNSFTPAAGNQAPVFGGTYPNVNGTIGSALSAPAATSYFSDSDPLTYLASPAGTAWPAGVTCNAATGQPIGTPTGTAATTTGCKIRASDGSLTTDSNSFNFVIGAAVVPVTMAQSGPLKNMNGSILPDGLYTVVVSSMTNHGAAAIATKTGQQSVSGRLPQFTLTGAVASTEYEYKAISETDVRVRGLARAIAS